VDENGATIELSGEYTSGLLWSVLDMLDSFVQSSLTNLKKLPSPVRVQYCAEVWNDKITHPSHFPRSDLGIQWSMAQRDIIIPMYIFFPTNLEFLGICRHQSEIGPPSTAVASLSLSSASSVPESASFQVWPWDCRRQRTKVKRKS
jgi:hypothetical protein